MRRTLVLATLVLVALAPAGATVAADGGGRPLSTDLTGLEEAPSLGDPDASGTATVTLKQGLGAVCSEISWQDVDGEVFAGHIHIGPPGSAGPVVVTLFTGSFGGTASVSGCTEDVDPDLIKAIRKNPEAYYVNLHSLPDFPGGAVRGQLSK
jgi:hypothetical protein